MNKRKLKKMKEMKLFTGRGTICAIGNGRNKKRRDNIPIKNFNDCIILFQLSHYNIF